MNIKESPMSSPDDERDMRLLCRGLALSGLAAGLLGLWGQHLLATAAALLSLVFAGFLAHHLWRTGAKRD